MLPIWSGDAKRTWDSFAKAEMKLFGAVSQGFSITGNKRCW